MLLLLLSDEVSRRDGATAQLRAQRAQLDPAMQLQRWDATAKVRYGEALLNELVSLRFVEAHQHVAIAGAECVGKTFLAHALGHIACRPGLSACAERVDRRLNTLRHARLDNSHETEPPPSSLSTRSSSMTSRLISWTHWKAATSLRS